MVRMRLVSARAALTPLLALTFGGCVASGNAGARGKTSAMQREQAVIPAFEVRGSLHPREGERVSAALRALLERTTTHTALPGRIIRGAQKQFGLPRLDRPHAIRLATQLGAGMLVLGTVEPVAAGIRADLEVLNPTSGDRFTIEDVTAAEPKALGRALLSALETSLAAVQLAATCRDEVAAARYVEALQACDGALSVVPTSSVALHARARALLALRRYREALLAHDSALSTEPAPDDLVLGAGLAASGAGETQLADRYYDRFLARNPTQRVAAARRIAQVGDFTTAYRLLEPAIPAGRANPELARFLFTLAAAAGQAVARAEGEAAARPYYENALRAHEQLSAPGTEPTLEDLRTIISIHAALGRPEQALRIAQETVIRHDTVSGVWSQYAAALAAVGRHAEAAAAFTRAIGLDPAADAAFTRRARAYLDAGRIAEALDDLAREAEGGGAEEVARLLFQEGGESLREERFGDAVELLEPAYGYATPALKQEIAFFLAFSLVKTSEALARRADPGSTSAAGALRGFRRAVALLRESPNPRAAQVSAFAEQYIASLEAATRGR